MFSWYIALGQKSKKSTKKIVFDANYAIKKIVIDAGHGGHDPGCHGKYSKEKHVALSIALKLGKLIEDNHPEVQVIYTRKSDKFIELSERAAIANRNNADLFISIHCNAIAKSSHRGTETWIMGTHRASDNLDVAKRENAAILLEDNYINKYDGFNPNSPESNIIFSLYQNAYMDQSANFANKVEKQFINFQNRESHGVKQAGFVVLWRAAMPAALIETGFLTNGQDESIMGNARGQQKIAESIYRAFRGYKNEMEGVKYTSYDYVSSEPDENDAYFENQNSDEINESEKNTIQVGERFDTETVTETVVSTELRYTVQMHSSSSKENLKRAPFNKVRNVIEEKINGKYVYYAGSFNTENEALNARNELRKVGFKSAFVVKKN